MDRNATMIGEAEVAALKPLLSVNDVVRLTGRSRRTVIRWLERTPGVILLFDHPEQMHKRRYRTFRIPRAAFEQIMRAKRIDKGLILKPLGEVN